MAALPKINMKLGLLQENNKPQDWIAGGFTPLTGGDINPSGQWGAYLPVIEYQNKAFDRQACVTYSLLNTLEVLYLHKTGKERNFSDRFLAKMSNTTKDGNYLSVVFDVARKFGLVDESVYPDVLTSWEDYYKDIPQDVKSKAKDFLLEWDLYREWVLPQQRNEIIKALKQAPLQVTVHYASGPGILYPSGVYNHAVMVYGYSENEYWDIFDHYEGAIKRYDWDYQFGAILKPTLNIKTIPMNVKQNNLFQLVESPGGFALGLDGNLIIDDTDKIIASFMMRNGGDIKGKTVPVTKKDWDSVPHYNLKGEKI